METATFAAGCFWGVEAAFRKLKGVTEVISGYTGGSTNHPTYEDVCSGQTGHAEAVEVHFDPKEISYQRLLEVFWQIHEPTSLNKQGNDIGSQYRAAVFYHTPEQKAAAEKSKERLEKSGQYDLPVMTTIEPAPEFWPAEEYHQHYLEKNPGGYCHIDLAAIH